MKSDIKIRCSAIGSVMPGARKSWLKSTDDYLAQLYVQMKYGREKDIESKYLKKGTQVEEDSIRLYSEISGISFSKWDDELENAHIKGTPDILYNEIVHDVKSCWDIFTFFANQGSDMKPEYYWQLQGYMALSGAREARLAYCLVDTPEGLIEQEKRSLMYKTGMIEGDHLHSQACSEIDRMNRYGDIPAKDRVIIQALKRDDEAIAGIYKRVEECRAYMDQHFPDAGIPVAAPPVEQNDELEY